MAEKRTERRPAESMTPPGGLKVLPSGLIVYEFEGRVTATGLLLPESPKLETEPTNRIGWFNPAGEVHEYITGTKDEGTTESLMFLLSNALKARKNGSIVLRALDKTGALVDLTIISQEGGAHAVSITAGGENKLIYNSAKLSSFLQLLGGAEKQRIVFGESSVTWSATEEKTSSEIKEITHGLGAIPQLFLAIPGASEAATVLVGMRYIEGSATAEKIKVRGYAPVAVAKSTTVKFYWCAIG